MHYYTMAQPVWRRDGPCGANQHNCLDTGHGDQCCDNESYCYVSSNGESRCCPLGSNCVGDSKCNSESYYCTRTISPTLSASVTGTAPNATETGCCGRRCPQPQYYLCPAALGGNCCPFGSDCQSDGSCISAVTSSTTATTTTRGGSTSGAATGTPTAEPPDGLSTATKTGIAVTVVAGVAVIAGMVIWLWLLKKRRRTRGVVQAVSNPEPAEGRVSGESPGQGDGGAGGRDTEEVDDYFGMGVPPAGALRAVPSQPQTPADITSPVEIDSALPREDEGVPETPRLETVVSNEVHELDATSGVVRADSSAESVIIVQDEIRDKELMI